jgi:hypothetical protein
MMSNMDIDNETLMELINEEDFHDISLFEKVAKRVFSFRDFKTIRVFLGKLRFSFLANDENYRIHILEDLTKLSANFSLKEITSICVDTLVGNYLAILILLKQNPIINIESIENITEIVPRLQCIEDVYLFGFPYKGDAILNIDERVRSLKREDIKKLAFSCEVLFNIGFFHKSRETVESFQNIYNAMEKPEYHLRAQLISSLLQKDFNQFSIVIQRFGYSKIESEEQIISEYPELWKSLQKLSIPVFLDVRNLRFNRVLFNGNFYFLIYMNFEGRKQIIFPFSQVELSDVNKIYDFQADIFYTPRERYGRLLLSDIYSFREISKVNEPHHDSVTKIISMDEDEIELRIRKILKDANLTSHSPVELADVLTQNLFTNNSDDLRLSGFIIKGQSFGVVHLNTIAGQLLQVSHSPIQIVFLVHIPSIDDRALRYFIQECESKQKNYCIVDRNDLARLFVAYKIL